MKSHPHQTEKDHTNATKGCANLAVSMDKCFILIRHFLAMLQKGFTSWQHLLLCTALKTAASKINHSPVLKQGNNWFPCPTCLSGKDGQHFLQFLLPPAFHCQDWAQLCSGWFSLLGLRKCLNLAMDVCQRKVLLCLALSSKSTLTLVLNGATTLLLSQLHFFHPAPTQKMVRNGFSPVQF